MLIKIVLICLIAVICHHAWKLMRLFNHSGHVHNHAPGPCQLIPGIERGAEDLHLLKNGLVLVSSGLEAFVDIKRRMDDHEPGRLFLFDFNKPNAIENLKLPDIFSEQHLHPHGISVFQTDASDIVTVFVINHHISGDRIEKFHLDLKTHKLTHLTTIVDDVFISMNDIVAVSEESFYVTQDFGTKGEDFLRSFELYLLFEWGSLAFYDGQKAHTVKEHLLSPNGIDISKDGRFVYMSLIGAKAIIVYERDLKTNDLTHAQTFVTYAVNDNVIVDKFGDLWIGCHPDGHQLMAHLKNASVPAPSEVLRLKTENGLITSMTEVYSDDGHTLYGSSSVIYHDNKILIGSVRQKLLMCHVKTL